MARSSRWRDSQAQQAQAPAETAESATPAADAAAPEAVSSDAPATPATATTPAVPPAPPAPFAAPGATSASPEGFVPTAPPAPPAPVGSSTPAPAGDASATNGTPKAVDGEVAELRSTLADLQATVAALVQRVPDPGAAGGTPATDQASRIIVMANRTAEATLEDARGEATGIVDNARAHAVEIVAAARELAAQELEAERARVAAATAAWNDRRVEISAHLGRLVESLGSYRSGLDDTTEAIRQAATELDAEHAEVPVIEELPAPDPAAFVGAELPGDAAEPTIDLTDGALADASTESADHAAPTGDAGAESGAAAGDAATPADVAGDLAASPRTSLFGGGGPLPTAPGAATVPREGGDVAEDADDEESEASRTLRPGLFGR